MMNVIEDIISGRVYMIYNVKTPHIYIGSTTQTLHDTWMNHMEDMKTSNSKLYNFMREIGIENFRMKIIDYKEIETEEQLRLLEQYYINKYDVGIMLNEININERMRSFLRNYRDTSKDEVNSETADNLSFKE